MTIGAMRNDGQSGTPDVWSVYLATEDAKATADAAAGHSVGELAAGVIEAELGAPPEKRWQRLGPRRD